MSESENAVENTAAAAPAAPAASLPVPPVTAGALLKAARQAAGVHMAVLSVNLKVPVRQLEALEANHFPAGQSPVFARALVCSVCRQLRTDPAPILALMPLTSNYLEPHGAVRYANTPPANLGRIDESSAAWPFKTIGASLGLLLLIVALVWMPNIEQWTWLQPVLAKFSATGSTAADGTASGASADSATLVASPATEQTPLGAVLATPLQAATPSAVGGVATNAAALPSELALTALGDSWVEVRDIKNQVLWTGVVKAGDTQRVPIVQSATVTIGRAESIQAVYKGLPVDLRLHTKENVARFEVNP
ncbi:MAG: Cytoskeleton protein RodZ [Pseudomonadota bacterium]|jgi:cytoskeleton protein RodZ